MKFVESKSFFALFGVALFSALSVGCAAVEEVGEGVENLGEEIEDEANDARRR